MRPATIHRVDGMNPSIWNSRITSVLRPRRFNSRTGTKGSHASGFWHLYPYRDPGSPSENGFIWNLNTIRFVSVIGHPLLIIWEYDELIPSVFHLHCWSNFIRCLHNWFLNIVYLRDQITFWEWFHGTYLYYAFRRWLNIPIIIWEYDEPIHAYRAWFLAQRLNSGDVSPYVSNSSLRENISIGELESQGGFPYMNKNVIIHPWYIFIYYIH